MHWVATAALVLVLLRWGASLWLERMNRRHVRQHANRMPACWRGVLADDVYSKAISYALARSRLAEVESAWDTAILLAALFSGVLPWVQAALTGWLGTSAWAQAVFLGVVGLGLALPSWPLEWYAQFHLEERFGFNTTTARLWWVDRVKGLVLAMVLGWPILLLMLKLVEWTGWWWWFWAWGAVLGFQALMIHLAPVFLLPLFNRFVPLPEGSLRERLLALAQRTGFRARSIQVMDGSKRSRHSNAFFTGLGRGRKVVLFDTLLELLTEPQVEAVLAHEIGHYQRRHLPKLLVWSAAVTLVGFFCLGWLARREWFSAAFGFETGGMAAAILLFALLSGPVAFWLSPLANRWSRRYEYEADAFAAAAVRESESLLEALRKLNEQNLSNPVAHPLYSAFHYSHPTLPEREQALRRLAAAGQPT